VEVNYITGEATLYIDGIVALSFTFSAPTPSSSTSWYLTVFGSLGGANAWVSGLIDSVSLWSRALTPLEHGTLYNNGNGLTYDQF
jgi:hypothetical protein